MASKRGNIDTVLGLYVRAQTIDAVLLRKVDTRIEVVRRFVRQRTRTESISSPASMMAALPGLKTSEESDYSIQIGDGGGTGGSDLFLGTEFGGYGTDKTDSPGKPGGIAPAKKETPVFTAQLREILVECEKLGFPNPRVAFCVAPPDVAYTEISTAQDEKSAEKGSKPKPEPSPHDRAVRRTLIQQLAEKRTTPFDKDRVAFVPMAPEGSHRRYAAVIPESSEPVTATLKALSHGKNPIHAAARVIDAELTVFGRYVEKSKPREGQTTAVVRVGSDDTLLLFYTGTKFRSFERLRSLTSFDAPDTVCSRMMLYQDEHKIGEVQHILVLNEGRNDPLIRSLRSYYPDAAIESFQESLIESGLKVELEGENSLLPGTVPAALVALRLLEAGKADDGGVNLLHREYLKKQRQKTGYAWHTYAMLGVLFLITLFFTWRYMEQAAEIERQDTELRANPIELPVDDPGALKARVDSLLAVQAKYTHALQVLDSLLVASDRWSRIMERTARATRDIGRLWFDEWEPEGHELRIEGRALSRSGVAALARRLDGRIEVLDFADVGDVRVYPFTMIIPIPSEIPRVAQYLQDVGEGVITDENAEEAIRALQLQELYSPEDRAKIAVEPQ